MTVQIDGLDQAKQYSGKQLGYSSWHKITQEQIDRFADATGDHQWIHVDQEAAKQGPFGTTIAHGYLTLSLLPILLREVIEVKNVGMAVNYGINKLRFPAPVPSNSEVRLSALISNISEFESGVQLELEVTVEVRDSHKPSLVGQILFRYYN
jgi:acyl dehydratase